eukprot:TRINITY_DN7764_c0_g1_i1.p1 TRINITY_DN7764_c0_g1~~TRINITY_DN7764_c0_g1_i1.p1  ORF type:complete len:182 (+),score=24.25 TRINITY_DN7764_c0_g1_i1:140-685(+)
MPSEYDTLTGSELFTKRAEAGSTTQQLEKFYIIARMYLHDQLQERKVVYTSCLLLIVLASTGLIYATGWQACPVVDPWKDAQCVGGYLNSKGACIKMTTSIEANPSHCFAIQGSPSLGYNARPIFTGAPNVSSVTCQTAVTATATCFGATPTNFTCPSQRAALLSGTPMPERTSSSANVKA